MFGVPTEEPGVNSRLKIISNTLKWIAHNIPEDIKHVCILGDLTHEHGRLTPPVLHTIQDVLAVFDSEGHPVSILAGNHDIDANGLSIISAFFREDMLSGVEVIEKIPMQLFFSFPLPIYAIPYGDVDVALDYLATIKEEAIALMHHSFEGAKHGPHEFQPPGGIPPKLIPEHIRIYSGHYHLRQRLTKNVSYIGAPLQHDFGESMYTPGYTILDLLTGEAEFVEVPPEVAPRFHILPYNLNPDKIPGLVESDYYRIDLPTDVSISEISKLRESVKNVIIKPIPTEVELRTRVEEHLGGEEKVDLFGVMNAYVALNAEKERADRLSDLGFEIAEKILGES
jgi:DNA repair exonuclease SbcCD nuclease subunit